MSRKGKPMKAMQRNTKEWRKVSLARKKEDRNRPSRRNPIARELLTLKYRQRNHQSQEKGGAKNLVQSLVFMEA